MKNNIIFFMICLIIIPLFACDLISEKDSPVKNSSPIYEFYEVFDAEDGNDGSEVGNFAKDFSYRSEDGTIHKISDLRDQKVVLLKLWAVRCQGCKESIPAFDTLHNKYSEEGLFALAMNLNDPLQDILTLAEPYNFANAYNCSKYMSGLGKLIPLYILIDKNGIIQFIGMESPTEEEIQDQLDLL